MDKKLAFAPVCVLWLATVLSPDDTVFRNLANWTENKSVLRPPPYGSRGF